MELQKGEKRKLSDFTAETHVSISVLAKMNSGELDISCFGVDGSGKLSNDRYFIFYNQPRSPEGAITMSATADTTTFMIQLDTLPASIQKLVVAVAADGGLMRNLLPSQIVLTGGDASASYAFRGDGFSEEKALILCELYRKDGIWRYAVVASGFNGGLSALLAHFGGEEASHPVKMTPTPVTAPAPIVPPKPAPAPVPAKVNLSKISLQKAGEVHKIDLGKHGGEIHVNLNWNHGKKGFFGGSKTADLDLACMYRLKNGMAGIVQALGNSFGSDSDFPYIRLDKDDRTGASTGGENMFFKKPELLEFAVVFAYIYEGVASWRGTDATVILHQDGAADVEIKIDNPDSRDRFCVLASLTEQAGSLEVRREDRFFAGHREVDQHYGFGFRWKATRK